MSVRKPPISDVSRDDERRTQQFLELAAPLLLERPHLDERAWGELRAAASRVGLSEEQLQALVEVLRRDGVVDPDQQRRTPVEIDLDACLVAAAIAAPPRAAAPPPPPPPRFRTGEVPGPAGPAENPALVRSFLAKSEAILAEQRGLTTKAQLLLADMAHAMGLSEAQYDEALRLLGARSPASAPPAPAEPRRPDTLPADRYRSYLQMAIQEKQRSRGYLSESAEHKLIEEGVRKLGLSAVFAGHLVQEVADQCGMPILSRQESSHDEVLDPRLESFIARAGSVVAQQRGVTAHAQVLLTAIGRELGLDEATFKRGMELLQGARRVADNEDSRNQWRQQRRECFRAYLDTALRPYTGVVLTPPEWNDLIATGTLRQGLEEEDARSVIREAATALRIHVVSAEQARQHVVVLIEERFADSGGLTPADQQQVLRDAQQWGISQTEVNHLVREAGKRYRERRRRDRQIMVVAITSCFLVTSACMWLFYDVILAERLKKYSSSPPAEVSAAASASRNAAGQPKGNQARERSDASGASPEPALANTWWDDRMRIAWVNIRRELKNADVAILFGVESEEPRARGKAYEHLAGLCVAGDYSPTDRRAFTEFTARCLARDPAGAAAEQLVAKLMNLIPAHQADLPKTTDDYALMLEALRVLALARSQAELAEGRAELITEALQRKLPAAATEDVAASELERRYQGELLRRVYRNVIHAAESQTPATVAQHAAALQPYMVRLLETSEVVRLTGDLLRSALPRAGADWRHFETAMKSTVFSEDLVAVLRMVDVYEELKDEEAQMYLAALLLSRADASVEELGSLEDVPKLVRSRLGVAVDESMTREDHVARYVDEADALLLRAATVPASTEEMILQILQLARHSSLGWALVRGDMDAYAKLRELAEPALKDHTEESVPETTSPVATMMPALPLRDEQLKQASEALRRSGSNWERRLWALQVTCAAAESTPDAMPAAMADELARYLLSDRSGQEHRERMALVHRLRGWRELRIALAHALDDLTLHSTQCKQMLAQFMNQSVEELTAEPGWQRAAQVRLLQEALATLARGKTPEAASRLGELQSLLRDEYVHQAAAMGMSAESLAASVSPADVRRRMLESFTGSSTAKTPDEPRLTTQRIQAAAYAAANDLELAIMLDRVWLQALATEHDVGGGAGDVAQPIVAQLHADDAKATGLLDQLRLGQASLIRLYLLKLRAK